MDSIKTKTTMDTLLKKFKSKEIAPEEMEDLIRISIRICYSQLMILKEQTSYFTLHEEFCNQKKLILSIISRLFSADTEKNVISELNQLKIEIEDESDAHYCLHRIINNELKQQARFSLQTQLA